MVKAETHLCSSRCWVSEHQNVGVAAHGLDRVGQRLSFLRRRGGFAEVDDGAAQALHGRREGATGASADLVEHGRHHLSLDGEEQETREF